MREGKAQTLDPNTQECRTRDGCHSSPPLRAWDPVIEKKRVPTLKMSPDKLFSHWAQHRSPNFTFPKILTIVVYPLSAQMSSSSVSFLSSLPATPTLCCELALAPQSLISHLIPTHVRTSSELSPPGAPVCLRVDFIKSTKLHRKH